MNNKPYTLAEFEHRMNRRLVSAQPYEAMRPVHFGNTDIKAVNNWSYRVLAHLMEFNRPEQVILS